MPCLKPGPGIRPTGENSGLWLRNAAGSLCVLAAAAAAVSFTTQYRMVDATRHLPMIAAPEASIPDAAALVFRLPGHRAGAARPPRAAAPGAEPGLGRCQRVHERDRGRAWLAEPGDLGHAPVAYALASDTLTASSGPGPWPATSTCTPPSPMTRPRRWQRLLSWTAWASATSTPSS
jgi:hypothetical protein